MPLGGGKDEHFSCFDSSCQLGLIYFFFLKISLFYPYFRGSGVVENEEIFKYEFTTHDLITLVLSTLVGVWYLLKKHWIANNLFGLAFAVNGVELLHLNNVMTGFILLGGLFFYDIFWVFATDVVSILTIKFLVCA